MYYFMLFRVPHLKRPLTISLDAINNHHWSFCFFISKTVENPMLQAAITTLWLSPPSSLLIISSFCEIIVTSFLFQQYLLYSSWGLLKPLIKFTGLNKTQISQIKITESVINSKTSSHRSNIPSLGTILPKY